MKLVVANHKMNLTKQELLNYQLILNQRLRTDIEIVICPCMAYITILQPRDFKLGSQNVAFKSSASLTGEVSAPQLKSLSVSYCLVGHSERRQFLNETSEMIWLKLKELLKVGITPILCIGETKEQRALGKTDLVLEKQIRDCFHDFSKDEILSCVIAYEPIWAIGTGLVANPQEIERTVSVIKEVLNRNFGLDCRILYGGSINSKNVVELEKIKNLDGYLVGGASLNPEEWISILNHMK